MWSIINIISCNTSIDCVYYHAPYFDVFVWWYLYILEEVRDITTQPILILAGDPEGILIGEAPKLSFVTWAQHKGPCYISQCFIRYFILSIEGICISTGCLKNYVHVMICSHKLVILPVQHLFSIGRMKISYPDSLMWWQGI